MTKAKRFFQQHRPAVVLMVIILVLTTIPVIDTFLVLGNAWQGFPPSFGDETMYFAHMHTIAEGYVNDGNPYFLEHRNDPPLVIFGGAWLNAVPLLAGIPFDAALMFNFIIWSLAFAALFYWLFREWRVPRWIAVASTVFLYLQSYEHVWRAVNLQTVYPFFFLFLIALTRFLRERSRKNIGLLAAATALSFYFFSYLWQTVVITLGILALYALVRKNWKLLKATLLSSIIGGIIGLPVPLLMLWLSRSSPYFWESIGRLGLVNTHLPMAEVVYSGGWIGVALAFLALLYWRMRTLRKDTEFMSLFLFLGISGLGIWIMQGSNLITGKLLETGEHMRAFIAPWLVFATVLLGIYLYKRRAQLTRKWRWFSVIVIAACSIASILFFNLYGPFINPETNSEFWYTEQLYVKPLAWLDKTEKNPVVVWSDPVNDEITGVLPVFTKHFTLFTTAATWELVSESEIRERYLISQYFNNPTVDSLKANMSVYLGRQDAYHRAATIDRSVKICRTMYFWDKNKNCGILLTPAELLGDKFFANLEQEFQTDIKPNIKMYLKKYHVSYILKDDILDPQYHPEKLGAMRVYNDGRFEIYRVQY
ncbi:MAG: hypothetical protein ABSB00_02755 [Minisyncoccia bacterium]|jgi:hypothetical protein